VLEATVDAEHTLRPVEDVSEPEQTVVDLCHPPRQSASAAEHVQRNRIGADAS
jgi:hypothetical protein